MNLTKGLMVSVILLISNGIFLGTAFANEDWQETQYSSKLEGIYNEKLSPPSPECPEGDPQCSNDAPPGMPWLVSVLSYVYCSGFYLTEEHQRFSFEGTGSDLEEALGISGGHESLTNACNATSRRSVLKSINCSKINVAIFDTGEKQSGATPINLSREFIECVDKK
jgi:hypothetical protein